MYGIKIIFLFFIKLLLFYPKIEFIIPDDFDLEKLNLYQEEEIFIQKENNWCLSIPKINLINIPIEDSVKSDILENYIGHFPISSYYKGNICLAAHNAGYTNNYFQNIHLLELGDEIHYSYYDNDKIYKVSNKYIINDNDFYFLDNDDNDKITLITCINNSPSKRLCIEAICEEEK